MEPEASSLNALLTVLSEAETLFVAAGKSEHDEGFIPPDEFRDRQQQLLRMRRAVFAAYRGQSNPSRVEIGVRIVECRTPEDRAPSLNELVLRGAGRML